MIIFNRDKQTGKFIIPADGWYHIAPFGDHKGDRELANGKTVEVMQRISNRAIDSMIAKLEAANADENFPGLLVDFEHFSHDKDKSTEAAGWIENLQKRDSGMWAKIRLSDKGEAAIRGGSYRGISPVWDGPEVEPGIVEPDELFDAGLTNKANLRGMVPLSNRQRSAGPTNQVEQPMKKLMELLGLDPAASEDAAVSKLGEIKNRAGQYDTLKTTHDNLLSSIADTDLDAAGITDADERAEFKPMLIMNRASTLKLLTRKAPEKKENSGVIHNRKGAATPLLPGQKSAPVKNRMQLQREAISAERISNRTHTQAYEAAKAKSPELFEPEQAEE